MRDKRQIVAFLFWLEACEFYQLMNHNYKENISLQNNQYMLNLFQEDICEKIYSHMCLQNDL